MIHHFYYKNQKYLCEILYYRLFTNCLRAIVTYRTLFSLVSSTQTFPFTTYYQLSKDLRTLVIIQLEANYMQSHYRPIHAIKRRHVVKFMFIDASKKYYEAQLDVCNNNILRGFTLL